MSSRQRPFAAYRLHACAGVLCPLHASCARYQFVDGTSEPSAYWLGNCAPPGSVDFPGFIAVGFVGPPKPQQFLLTRRDVKARAKSLPQAEHLVTEAEEI